VFARGGPGALADALEAAALGFGAEVRTSTEVAAVTMSGGRVAGVALASGVEIPSPVVVSSLDPKRTLLGLLDPVVIGPSLAWRVRNIRTPGVVAKVNLAFSALPRFTALQGSGQERRFGENGRLAGRILVATGIDDLERAFDASKYGRVSDRPYLEATIPSVADPSLAAGDRHVMSVLVQYVPYRLRDGGWEAEGDALGDLVLRALDPYAPGIADLVQERQVLTPVDLERDYGLTEGHPLHGEPGLDQFFAWRPLLGHARYRMPVRGLYLCGSGAHPGGGVTGAPGANAAREVVADWKRRR
jgi:phytoene dehydrogenase-like protein